MYALKTSHPIRWPNHSQRTPKWDKSVNSSFKQGMSMVEALTFLKEELQVMNPQSATLLTDYENLDNPRLTRKIGNDQGVVLKLKLNDQPYEIACDRWLHVEHNIYALHLVLRSVRSIVDWGVGDYAQVLGGFSVGGISAITNLHAAVGANDASLEEWRLILGLGPTANLEDAHAVYRRRAKMVADNQSELTRLNLAMDEASKALGG